MTSNEPSDAIPIDRAFDLERDVPTTAVDVAFLRRLRQPTVNHLPRMNELSPPPWAPPPPCRKTSEGWEPFEL